VEEKPEMEIVEETAAAEGAGGLLFGEEDLGPVKPKEKKTKEKKIKVKAPKNGNREAIWTKIGDVFSNLYNQMTEE
jgi:hypothetical protein